MSARCQERIISATIILFGVCAPCHLGASMKNSSLSIAVVSVLDGDEDEKSRDMAGAISASLGLVTPHHIVDTELAASVAQYHDGEAGAKPPDVSRAEDELAKAKQEYLEFHYTNAKKIIDGAVGLLEAYKSDLSTVGETLLDAYLTRALISKSLGDLVAVRMSIKDALGINPKLVLEAKEYPPSVVSIFEEEMFALGEGSLGSVEVGTKPKVADVYLNGVRQGVTPLVLEKLPVGVYSISIRANKYKTVERRIEVTLNHSSRLDERLKWMGQDKLSEDVAERDAAASVREGLRIAQLLKIDKVVLVDADRKSADTTGVSARMVDRYFGAGQQPICFSFDERAESSSYGLAQMTRKLADEAGADLTIDPAKKIDPKGIGKPILLSKRKRALVQNPIFWGVVGAFVAGAVGGGLAASMSDGGSSTGTVKVGFR